MQIPQNTLPFISDPDVPRGDKDLPKYLEVHERDALMALELSGTAPLGDGCLTYLAGGVVDVVRDDLDHVLHLPLSRWRQHT